MKIAIVHDYFIQMGGAEKVADQLHALFPTADLVTTVDIHKRPGVVTSWMQHLPITEKNHRALFLLFPLAVETLDLRAYDLIISSSSGYAKGVRTRPDAVHICYCHTPMRWVWRYAEYAERESFNPVVRAVLPALLAILKRWDIAASRRPDHYIANSNVVADRIRRFYGRESTVIHPPIDTERFAGTERQEDFYLILSRLAAYKRLDIAVEACRRLGKKLVIIGDGPARRELEALGGPTTQFLGRQDDETVASYARRCRALIFPGEEDFGMTPLEINSAGRPVIAFRGGGAEETVIEGKTGLFFDEQTPESVMDALARFESIKWEHETLIEHSRKFGLEVFASAFLNFVDGSMAARSKRAEHFRPGQMSLHSSDVPIGHS